MSSPAFFYLPVISPPVRDPSNPPSYYAAITASGVKVTADTTGSDGALEIRVTNSNQLHPSNQFTHPLPLSTVYAPTSGFVRFYPKSALLPTPDQEPIDLPSNLITTDIGSVVIRVWISDYAHLSKAPSATRPNRIVLGRLQRPSVKAAFNPEVSKLPIKVLEKAWQSAGGAGSIPDRGALEASFLQSFMEGDAEIFVSAGAVLGMASIINPPPSEVAQVKLQTFFVSDKSNLSVSSPAEDMIDNAVDRSEGGSPSLFEGHPLIEAANAPIDVHFRSQFMIWDNSPSLLAYVPFVNAEVTLIKNLSTIVGKTQTGADGSIDLNAHLLKRDVIYFKYATNNKQFGLRQYKEDVATDSHKARLYLDKDHKNEKTYKAKWEFSGRYAEFAAALEANGDNEKFEDDRGNAGFFQSFLTHIKRAEGFYKAIDTLPRPTFNLLVEGDSWLHYPLDLKGDTYDQLDELLLKALRKGKAYNRFPLQHFGDRSDQMFVSDSSGGSGRQWDLTSDLLSEYRIDLIVCSAGGNDFAEPGIGDKEKVEIYRRYFTGTTNGAKGYFDPFLARDGDSSRKVDPLDSAHLHTAERVISRSFAALLRNHRWNLYLSGKEMGDQIAADILYAEMNQQLAALGRDFGEGNLEIQRSDLKYMQDIGEKVIANFPEMRSLPNPAGDKYDKLLTTVFDYKLYARRYNDVLANWRVLMNRAKELQIPVITHSYCYPLFNISPTSLLGWGKTPMRGPWFSPRFDEANMRDLRIQKICLKTIVDNYVWCVLVPLKQEYGELFDYVDVREINAKVGLWRDEMHLWGNGFREVASKIFGRIGQRFPQFFG